MKIGDYFETKLMVPRRRSPQQEQVHIRCPQHLFESLQLHRRLAPLAGWPPQKSLSGVTHSTTIPFAGELGVASTRASADSAETTSVGATRSPI